MSRLHEIQRAFTEGVIEGKHQALAAEIHPSGSALRSVAIYRRLIRNNFYQVLKVTYPVLYRLVGKRYFEIVSRGYIKIHPSTSGDLFSYGRHLPAFLKELNVSPLFVEVARLDWACHEAHQAADAPPVSRDRFQEIFSIDPSQVIVQFHAASQLLFFPSPVHRVWSALQPDAPPDETVDLPLPEEETAILVTRPFRKVQVTPLGRKDALLLKALLGGADLASAFRMAVVSKPGFDLSGFLAELLKRQIVTGFSVRGAS